MAKKKKTSKAKLPDIPTSYADFQVMYDHIVEQYRSNSPSIGFGQSLEWEGFDKLKELAAGTKEFVLAAHHERYAPIPEYEVGGGLFGGAGIMWYVKLPNDHADQRVNAHGMQYTHYDMLRCPGVGVGGGRDNTIMCSYDLNEMMLWAELFNMVLERRGQWREGENQLL